MSTEPTEGSAAAYNPFDLGDDPAHNEPAPAPPTTPAPSTPAPASAPAQDEPEAARLERERLAEIDRYAARRRRYTLAVVALLVIAAWWVKPWSTLTSPVTATPKARSTAQAAHPATGPDPIKVNMKAIHARLAKDGDLTGMTLSGAQVAAAGTTLYAARVLDEQCTVYGVIDGQDITPTVDPTAQACTGQIAIVQAELDRADQFKRAAAVSDAETALGKAANSAAFYAMSNFHNGQPSLRGITSAELDGVTVVGNHGDYLTLRARVGDTCRSAMIDTAGNLGEISTC